MSEISTDSHCLNCDTPDSEMPLISVRYTGRPVWICSQCMPVLIHETDQIKAKLDRAES
jgi:hypothetical protein